MRCHILSHGIFSFVNVKILYTYILTPICLKIAVINKQFLIVENLPSQNARLSSSINNSVKSVVKVNREEKRYVL